jgi:hypothetical protein
VFGRFLDAHNLFVQQAVTTGLIGLALFGLFLLGVLRRVRSALGVFGLLLAATTLLQPSFVGMTPVAFLAMGASAAVSARRPWRRPAFVVALIGAIAGLVAGAMFVRADANYKVANELDTNAAAALVQADRWMPPWWEVAREGTLTTFINDKQTALAWAREAARRDPQSALAMSELGAMERRFGSTDAAWSALERSLVLDPSMLVSGVELRDLAARTGRPVPAAAERVLAADSACLPTASGAASP